jgi:hypothetical protein
MSAWPRISLISASVARSSSRLASGGSRDLTRDLLRVTRAEHSLTSDTALAWEPTPLACGPSGCA